MGNTIYKISPTESAFTRARNVRHLTGGAAYSSWLEVAGQLNSQITILSMVEFNNELYAGTANGARLFKWNGTNAWVQAMPQYGSSQQLYSLTVFNSKLYALPSSADGTLLEWNGVDTWTVVSTTAMATMYNMIVYNLELYATDTLFGKLYKWNGVNAWIEVAGQLGTTNAYSLVVYNNKIYSGTSEGIGGNAVLLEWNGTNAWSVVGTQSYGATIINQLAVFGGKLYAVSGGGGTARLLEWNNVDTLTSVGTASGQAATSLVEYDGGLHVTGAGDPSLYIWDGASTLTAVLDRYDSLIVHVMLEFDSKIYGGTETTARLLEYESGGGGWIRAKQMQHLRGASYDRVNL